MARNKRRTLASHEPILHDDHKRPVTRRDFLNAGFITSAATVVMPSLLTSFFSKKASAAFSAELDCGIGGLGSGMIPFICIDLGGGANMLGSNVMVGPEGSEGQMGLLSGAAYNKMGVPTGMSPIANPNMVNTELGLAFHGDSAFLRGILSKTTASCRANVSGAVIPARSDNDTQNNPHNPMYGIARAGATGSLAKLIGTQNSDSGGRSMAPAAMIDLNIRPTKISSRNDARGLVDTGAVSALMPDKNEAGRIMEAVERISLAKINGSVANLDAVPDGTDPDGSVTTMRDQVRCGYAKTTETVSSFSGPDAVDPQADSLIVDPNAAIQPTVVTNQTGNVGDLTEVRAALPDGAPIFTGNELNDGKNQATAAVMKLILGSENDPFAGAGTLSFGGYDYHNGTRGTGEVRDFEAGQAMGAILQYAHMLSTHPDPNQRRSRPVMIYVFTDGSLASNGNIDGSNDGRDKGEWTGDNSSVSASFFLVYRPGGVGRPELLSTAGQTAAQHQQLGWMSASGSVVTNGTTPGANSPNLLAEMAILNWMALHPSSYFGNMDARAKFAELFPEHGLGSTTDLDRWIAFAPII